MPVVGVGVGVGGCVWVHACAGAYVCGLPHFSSYLVQGVTDPEAIRGDKCGVQGSV